MRKKFVGLYEEPTMYQYDYINLPIKPQKIDYLPVKPKRPPPKIKLYEAHDTYQRLDYEKRLPFDALWEPKDFLNVPMRGTHKKKVLGDPFIEDIIKTRPRLFMDPAICLDNIQDMKARKEITDVLYVSTLGLMNKEVWGDFKPQHICHSMKKKEKPSEPTSQKPRNYLPIGFQSAARQWEFLQDCSFVHETVIGKSPTEELKAKHAYVETVDPEIGKERERIKSVVANGNVSIFYDKLSFRYGGFRPFAAVGTQLEKK